MTELTDDEITQMLTELTTQPEPTVAPPDASIQQRFEAFHSRHPNVYAALVHLARQGVAAGRRRLGMKQLFEVLRWGWSLNGLPDEHEQWKLSNDYTSRYARLIMDREPDLAGMFATRDLTAD